MTKLLLNGSPSVNYFIHGQELTLEFDFPKAWLVVVSYNQIPVSDKFKTGSFWFWQRNTFFFSKKNIFKSYINHFSPKLEIRLFESWSIIPKKIVLPLKNNRVLLTNPIPRIKQIPYPSIQAPIGNFKHQVKSIGPLAIKNVNLSLELKSTAYKRFFFEAAYHNYKLAHPLFLQNQ
ncbi:MAG: hypothetical protein RL440_824 [Bacteroidota bacterium]|jgi:hypothetical protein